MSTDLISRLFAEDDEVPISVSDNFLETVSLSIDFPCSSRLCVRKMDVDGMNWYHCKRIRGQTIIVISVIADSNDFLMVNY